MAGSGAGDVWGDRGLGQGLSTWGGVFTSEARRMPSECISTGNIAGWGAGGSRNVPAFSQTVLVILRMRVPFPPSHAASSTHTLHAAGSLLSRPRF